METKILLENKNQPPKKEVLAGKKYKLTRISCCIYSKYFPCQIAFPLTNACAWCVRDIRTGRMHVTNIKGLQAGLSVNYWRGEEVDYIQYQNIIHGREIFNDYGSKKEPNLKFLISRRQIMRLLAKSVIGQGWRQV